MISRRAQKLLISLTLGISLCTMACSDDDATLIIYSGRSESLVGPIIEQFSRTTGIPVSVKYAKTGALAATLLEEGNKTPADLFFAQDPGGLKAVESVLSDLSNDILSKAPDWAKSPEGKWVGLSGRARTVIYNSAILDEADLPDDLLGFTDPKWNGQIGWAPTNGSFQTMVTAMRALWGEDKTRWWLEGIKANKPKQYPKNTPTVLAVSKGEINVGFVNHYYLHRFLAEEGDSFSAKNYHPRGGGPGALVLVAGAGILDASENKVAARKFLEFMLSSVAQQYFADQTFEYPVVEGIKTQIGLIPLDEIKFPDLPLWDLKDIQGTQNLLRDLGILS